MSYMFIDDPDPRPQGYLYKKMKRNFWMGSNIGFGITLILRYPSSVSSKIKWKNYNHRKCKKMLKKIESRFEKRCVTKSTKFWSSYRTPEEQIRILNEKDTKKNSNHLL